MKIKTIYVVEIIAVLVAAVVAYDKGVSVRSIDMIILAVLVNIASRMPKN